MDHSRESISPEQGASDSGLSDQELVDAAARGQHAAFEALYLRYRDWIHRLAWRFTRDPHHALDVLQETFSYLLRRLPTLRLTSRLTTFLYPAVRHLSLQVLRRNGRAVGEAFLDEMPARAGGAEGISDDLAAILGGLPEGHRQVVLMRFVDGMGLEEIAEAVSLPVGTVKSRLHNALEHLRNDTRTRRYFLE